MSPKPSAQYEKPYCAWTLNPRPHSQAVVTISRSLTNDFNPRGPWWGTQNPKPWAQYEKPYCFGAFTAKFRRFHCKVSALSLQSFGLFTAKSFCSAAKFRFFFWFHCKVFFASPKKPCSEKKSLQWKRCFTANFFFSLQSHFAMVVEIRYRLGGGRRAGALGEN